jgi:hypothetical protein
MRLLADTLRSNYWLGSLVKYLKLPYTIRESLNSDVTRAVGACPNLRYVDLSTGFFAGEARFDTLRHEIWINCPEIRTIKYTEGSERYFKALGDEDRWRSLEIITLQHVRVDTASFRFILALLPNLHTLVLDSLPDLSDDIFSLTSGVSEFPALKSLELHSLPHLTSAGLMRYLTSSQVRDTLLNLTLDGTGIQLSKLHILLAASIKLQSLIVIETVSTALPLDPIPPLQSPTLQTLHFEIQSHPENIINPQPSDSYHYYLLNTIIGGNLPNLRTLYVRDPSFPSALTDKSAHYISPSSKQLDSVSGWDDSPTLPHTPRHIFDTMRSTSSTTDLLAPPRMNGELTHSNVPILANQPRPRRRTFNESMLQTSLGTQPSRQLQPLEVYTKGQHEEDWLFAPVQSLPRRTPSQHSTGSANAHRPLSTFNVEWASNARRSVFVADGEGGFLAVPDAPLPERPRTSAGSECLPNITHLPTPLADPLGVSPKPEAWEERWGVVRGQNGDVRVSGEWGVKKRKSWWDVHAGTGKRGSRADMWR